MKGQTLEMLGFLILSVAVIGIIIFMRTYLAGSYGKTLLSLMERQETEGMRSGLNTILQTTDPKTGRKMEELIGISSYTEKVKKGDKIDFGPGIGEVDILTMLEERFNGIYGEGKWYLKVPPADKFFTQIVIVVDTSASLCDDVDNIKSSLPKIIQDLSEEYDITATIYMLPGADSSCCKKTGYGGYDLTCDLFEGKLTDNLQCMSINSLDCVGNMLPQNEEDWSRGLGCIIQKGPPQGWNEKSTKIGIILSDELSGGNDDSGEELYYNMASLEIGKKKAEEIGMYVFPIKTETGRKICPGCDCPNYPECSCAPNICVYYQNQQYPVFSKIQCKMDGILYSQMKRIAEPTEGDVYELSGSGEATKSILEIIKRVEAEEREKRSIKLGIPPPKNKKINTETLTIPIPLIGKYTNIYLYQWS